MRSMIALLLLLTVPGLTLADSDVVRKPSPHSVAETMNRLEVLVRQQGMRVFARINHKVNAQTVGKRMPDSQVLIFGNPNAGTRIMLNDPAAGLDLPIRVAAYVDFDDKVWVAYHNPQGLTTTYDLGDCKVLDKIEAALDGLTNQITK